jgi:hypothetical protein
VPHPPGLALAHLVVHPRSGTTISSWSHGRAGWRRCLVAGRWPAALRRGCGWVGRPARSGGGRASDARPSLTRGLDSRLAWTGVAVRFRQDFYGGKEGIGRRSRGDEGDGTDGASTTVALLTPGIENSITLLLILGWAVVGLVAKFGSTEFKIRIRSE